MAISLPAVSVDLLERARRTDGPLSSWTDEEIRASEIRYRRFLLLAAKYPDRVIVPARDIDEVWHLHMLSPVAYYEDCMRIAGQLLDHDGGFGRLDEEKAEWEQLFSDSASLWEKEFGEPYGNEKMTCSGGWGLLRRH